MPKGSPPDPEARDSPNKVTAILFFSLFFFDALGLEDTPARSPTGTPGCFRWGAAALVNPVVTDAGACTGSGDSARSSRHLL